MNVVKSDTNLELSRAGVFMPAEKHDFDLRISAIATQRAFKNSFSDGIRQVGLEVTNLLTRTREIASPENASFSSPIEHRINPSLGTEDLYWPGYDQSIDESMTRTIALARRDRIPKDQIQALYAQREVWRTVRNSVLNLSPGQAVNYFVPRGLGNDISQGISFGQIENNGGRLIQNFQLLPPMSEGEMQKLQNTINQNGQRITINVNNINLSSGLSWISIGQPINFQNELPRIIQTTRQSQQRFNNVANLITPTGRIMAPSFIAGVGSSSRAGLLSDSRGLPAGVSVSESVRNAPANSATHQLGDEGGFSQAIPALMFVAAESLASNMDLLGVGATSTDGLRLQSSMVTEEFPEKTSADREYPLALDIKEAGRAPVEMKQDTTVAPINKRRVNKNITQGKSSPQVKVETSWDNRMLERFQQATTETLAREILHDERNTTNVKGDIFVAEEVVKQQDKETEFKQIASDLVVTDLSVQDGMVATIEETVALLLPEIRAENVRNIHKINLEVDFVNKDISMVVNEENADRMKPYKSRNVIEVPERPRLLFLPSDMAQAFLVWQQGKTYADLQPKPPEFFLKKSPNIKAEADFDVREDNSYIKHTEKNQQVKQPKLKGKKPSLAFLSLLFLIKLKLQAQNIGSFAKLKKLILADSLLLFLLKPNLFLAPKNLVAGLKTGARRVYNEKTYEFTAW